MRTDVTPRDILLDRRIVERNIRKGVVTREEYERHLQTLPDVGANAELIAARLGEREEAVDDDDDLDDEDDADDEG
jgi:hypothetical protein